MVFYAVVGASRGIGLEYVRQLGERPDTTVFAIVRNAQASTDLAAPVAGLRNVHVVEGDITSHGTLEAAAKVVSQMTGGTLDCLIHVAARMERDTAMQEIDDYASMDDLDAEFLTSYKVNTLGVIHSIVAFRPLLRASTAPIKKVVVLSTAGADYRAVRAASLSSMAAYCTTKASGLMATTKWALKLKGEGVVVVSIDPGLVDTSGTTGGIGIPSSHDAFEGFSAASGMVLQTPTESVAAQLQVIDGLKSSDAGLFFSHLGGVFGV